MLLHEHRNVVDLIPAPRTAGSFAEPAEPAEPAVVFPSAPSTSRRRVALAGFVLLTGVVVGAAWATSPTPPPPVPLAPPAPVAPPYPTPEEPLLRAVFR